VTTNVADWNFELEDAKDAEWVKISMDGGIKIAITENTNLDVRDAKVIITAQDLKEELLIEQAGMTPVFGITSKTVSFPGDGGTSEILMTEKSNLGTSYDLIISEGDEDWLSAEKGQKKIIITAAENEPTERSGTVTITSKWIPEDIVVEVSQQAGGVTEVKLTALSFSSNASDPDEGKDFSYLIDGLLSTYWHTTWHGDIPLPHWLQVDLGEKITGKYAVYYGTRSGSANNAHNPAKFDLMGSLTGEDNDEAWFLIRSFDKDADGLPVGPGKEYTSPILETDKEYRYIRIFVNEKSTTGNNFWNMSEFKYYKQK